MALSRSNFRAQYYKTLGVPVVPHIVDVEAAYASVFGERTINTSQLVKVALEVGVPSAYRAWTWQVLTGVLPPCSEVWQFVMDEKQQMYMDVVDSIRVLTSDSESDDDVESLLHLHQTYWERILSKPSLSIMHDQDYYRCIGRVVRHLFQHPSDRFWVFTKVSQLLSDTPTPSFICTSSSSPSDSLVLQVETHLLRVLEGSRWVDRS